VEQTQIDTIVQRVLAQLQERQPAPEHGAVATPTLQPAQDEDGLFDDMEDAVEAARQAQAQLIELSLEKRKEIIAAIRKAGVDNAQDFSERTFKETNHQT